MRKRLTSSCWSGNIPTTNRFVRDPPQRCSYFTNTDRIKADDPYRPLGLTWGATREEIRAAYRQKAAQLHPDVNRSPDAHEQFQTLQRAYQRLVTKNNTPNDDDDAWSFRVWTQADRLAVERTDVAGLAKQRPIPPASITMKRLMGGAQLGHPDGRGVVRRSGGELLGSGETDDDKRPYKTSSSVGRGNSKWVPPEEFVPWNGETTINRRRASNFASQRIRKEQS
jgi:hypothetical protein